ncbi:MAG: helix-turn-helix domain-containing protein [Bacteroidales bacterium]|nr:helix-turn-helix domain-containing protein [Bacteroidales bacterium]
MNTIRQILHNSGYAVYHIDASSRLVQLPDESQLSVLLLCEDGKAVIEGNMQRVTIEKCTRLLGSHVIQPRFLEISHDFKAWVLLVADSFTRDILVGVPTEKLGVLYAHPAKQVVDEHEWQLLCSLMKSLYMYDSIEGSQHSLEVAGCIFRSMLLVMAEGEMRAGNFSQPPVYTMADTYFRDFVHLVSSNGDREHEVAFYAGKLNITTKYLSDICKQKTGKGAKELISDVLIAKLKREIKVSGLSLKEIAYKYAFADQSSMGKFFRKMTGLSPLAFKQAGGIPNG